MKTKFVNIMIWDL